MMDDKQLTEEYLDGKVVFPGKIIRVEHWHVRLPNGETALREVACHPGAAGIVALDDDGNVILVRPASHRRWPLDAGNSSGPKLDGADEDPFVCAQRELSEETGLTADHWRKLTVLETTPGFCNERIHLYLATGLHAGKTHPDEDEFVCTLRMPLSDAVQKVMDGTFRDGKTALALLMVQQLLSAPCKQ